MMAEPTTLPLRSTRLPLACSRNKTCAAAVTTAGYTRQHRKSSESVITNNGRSCFIGASSEVEHVYDHVDQLDADERQQHAAAAVHEQVAAQDALVAHRAVFDATQCERNERNDDQRVEDHGAENGARGRTEFHDVE